MCHHYESASWAELVETAAEPTETDDHPTGMETPELDAPDVDVAEIEPPELADD